jgi:hypothetical protein
MHSGNNNKQGEKGEGESERKLDFTVQFRGIVGSLKREICIFLFAQHFQFLFRFFEDIQYAISVLLFPAFSPCFACKWMMAR